jgi:hypothetical protein
MGSIWQYIRTNVSGVASVSKCNFEGLLEHPDSNFRYVSYSSDIMFRINELDLLRPIDVNCEQNTTKARWHRSLLRLLWGTRTRYWRTTVVHTTQGLRRAAVWRRVRHMRHVRDGSQHENLLFHFCWIQLRSTNSTSLYIAVQCYRLWTYHHQLLSTDRIVLRDSMRSFSASDASYESYMEVCTITFIEVCIYTR